MPQQKITDTFKVLDEDGVHHSVQEITSFEPSEGGGSEPYVFYQFEDGRRLKARLASREFEAEDTGAIFDRA